MRRDATGQLIATKRAKGTVWGLRFRTATGERVYETLGRTWDGMDRREAERQAERLLAQARLGIYRSRAELDRERAEREAARHEDPLFGPFAEQWFARRCDLGGRTGAGLSASGRADLRNILDQHLLPWFSGQRLVEIDVREVEAYAAAKLRRGDVTASATKGHDASATSRDGRIGPTYLNKSLATLRAILRDAVRYGLVGRNAADGVRVASVRFNGSHLDTAVQISALLDAAGALDRERERRTLPYRRALLATLTFAGLRIDEALGLRWSQVDLASGKLRIRGSKTAAAERTIEMLPALREELSVLKASRKPQRWEELVFGTSSGGKDSPSNVRRRVLAAAVEKANEQLALQGAGELPHLTPHSLRRTFCSLLYALGEDPGAVMDAMGHTDPALALRVYRRAMRRGDDERAQLRALVEGAAAAVPESMATAPPALLAS